MTAITLNLDPITRLTPEQFYELCMANRNVAMERSPTGELIIVPPIGGVSGEREADLITELVLWNRQTQAGVVFSSSTVFNLPNGGDRSPDAAWVRKEVWDSLSQGEKEKFPPICPDFIIELRSRSDRLKPLQAKMQEYLASGLQLGWLINPQDQQVEIYRPNQQVKTLAYPVELSGELILPGFKLFISKTSEQK